MSRYKYLLDKIFYKLYFDALFSFKNAENGYIKLSYKDISQPLYLRKHTSDIPTFKDIFYTKQYNIDFGIAPRVIIDCGANIGLASVYFKNRYPDATIIAVEPEASNFELLQKNTVPYKDVHCLQAGIWNSDTNLEIINIDSADNWSFMTEEKSTATATTIPAISIDSIISEFGIDSIDILKVDIEGSEKELFEKNYEQWLPKVKILIIELHDNMRSGTANSVFNAVSRYPFNMILSGENLVFDFTKG